MVFASLAYCIKDKRRCGGNFNTGRAFAVQCPQWIYFKPSLAILAEMRFFIVQKMQKPLFIQRPALFTPERIYMEGNAFNAQSLKKCNEHLKCFRIYCRIVYAEYLRAYLVKLAEPSFLRPFISEHRAH